MKYNDLGEINIDRLLGPTYQFQRSMERIQDAIMPRSIRSMLDTQDRLHASNPSNILGLAGLQSLQARTAPYIGLFGSMTAVTDAMRAQDLLPTTAAGLATQLHDLLGPQLAWSAAPTLGLAQNLASILHEPAHLHWQQHLVRSLTPSFDLFANWSPEPVGLLAFMQEPELGASLTWVTDDETRPSAAALMPEGQYLPKIAIDTVVRCFVCGEELIQREETLRWKGNRIRIDITVVPICAACLQKAGNYSDYILDAIDEFVRPPLRLMQTCGESDGVPRGRGKLRLLTPDDADDSGGLEDEDEG